MEDPETVPGQIAGFTVLPLALPNLIQLPFEATHYLYLRPHEPKHPSPTAARSLFLVNVPFDSTEVHFKHLFSVQLGLPAGRVEAVKFHDAQEEFAAIDPLQTALTNNKKKKRKRRPDGPNDSLQGTLDLPSTWDRELREIGSNAVIIFVDRTSMEAALKVAKTVHKSQKRPLWGEGVEERLPPLGLERYLKHEELTYPPKDVLMESVNNYLAAFNVKETEEAGLRERQRHEPDADGFIMVTKGGRTNPARPETAQAVAEKHKERRKDLDDFYRFQAREKKKAKANELVKKFEQDREKIRELKASKQSKPESATE